MAKKVQVLVLNSEKKHSVRYDAEDKLDQFINTVYLTKFAFKDQADSKVFPKQVKITIEWVG